MLESGADSLANLHLFLEFESVEGDCAEVASICEMATRHERHLLHPSHELTAE